MREVKVRVPKPITYRKNILIMEFISEEELPAPELRMIRIDKPATRFRNIAKRIKIFYKDAGLVHGDMSEYNILVSNGELVIIDVGQAVLYDHPLANELLEHDIKNIAHYFKRTYQIKVNENKLITEVFNLREDAKNAIS